MRIDIQMFHDTCPLADTRPAGERKVPEFKIDYTDEWAWYLICPRCSTRVSAYIAKPE